MLLTDAAAKVFVFKDGKPIPDCAARVCKNGLSCWNVLDVEFSS